MSITSTMVQFSQTNSYLAKVEGEGKIASTAKTAGRSVVLIAAGVVAAFEAAITGIAIGLLTAVAYATDRANASLENAKARFTSIKQTITEVLGKKTEEKTVEFSTIGESVEDAADAIADGFDGVGEESVEGLSNVVTHGICIGALSLIALGYIYYSSIYYSSDINSKPVYSNSKPVPFLLFNKPENCTPFNMTQ